MIRRCAIAWLFSCTGALLPALAAAQGTAADRPSPERQANPAQTAPGNGRNNANGPSNGRTSAGTNGIANGNADARPAYQDALIDGGNLEPDIWVGETPEQNTDGWPRGLRLDALYAQQRRGPFEDTRYGVGVGGFLATPHYGSISFDGVFGHTEEGWLATLWQRDMPFEDGWRATNGAGNLNTPSIDYARFQPRWYVPTTPMLGASTEWRSVEGSQLIAAAGEPGVFSGLYVPGFSKLGGYVTTVGGQWQLTRNVGAGLQYAGARDVTNAMQIRTLAEEFSTRSWYGAAAWQERSQRYQVNLLGSHNNFSDDSLGAWADAMIQDGRYTHGFGAFWLGSDLAWANQPVGSDSRGVYYRINYGSRQWLWDISVDYADPIGERSTLDASTFVSGSVRHQLWQNLALGGGTSARFTNGPEAWSGFAFVENSLSLLINRTQINVARNAPQKEVMLSVNQTWTMPAGTRLATTLQAGRYEDGELSSNQYGLAVNGGGDLARDLALDANVQWLRSTGDAQPTTLIGTLSLTWQFMRELQLLATLYSSQTRSDQGMLVTSPIDDLAFQLEDRINDRGFVVTLRYATRAGTMAAPLGGAVGGGAGRIVGYVFLDGNEDGRMTAGEQGAGSVTVILNGRWSVRTDAQGRFEFPSVASGQHTITVMPDNLALPWQLVNDGRIQFDVPVRGTVNVDIPAQRMR